MKKGTITIIVIVSSIIFVALVMALLFNSGSNETVGNKAVVDYGVDYSVDNSEVEPAPINQEEEILSNAAMPEEEAYNVVDLLKVNDLETYRGLMFNDNETASLIVGAGLVKKIFKDSNVTAAIIATEQNDGYGSNYYYSKANFDGRYAVVLFRGEPKLLVNDVLLFKGLVTNKMYQSDDYHFTEKMPILLALYYKAGDLTRETTAQYFVTQAMRAKAQAESQRLVDDVENARANAATTANSAADAANRAAADAANRAAADAANRAAADVATADVATADVAGIPDE